MGDLISVIIPVYKVEDYLPRCVDSVLAQTYTNLEIFLVDDGSPDNCGKLCDEYAARDQRIKVIHKKNGGLSDARNAALDVCSGEYISFVDSDDYVSEDFIESLYHAIVRFDAKLAVCGVVRFDESGNTSVNYEPSKEEKCVTGLEMAETVWRPSACNKLYHKSLFQNLRYPYGKLYEDLFIYHDILSQLETVSFTGKVSYYYFNRPVSIMNKPYDIRNADLIEALDLRIQKLRDMHYSDLADRQLSFLFNATVEVFCRIPDPDDKTKARLHEVKSFCDRHFPEMMNYKGFTPAQKAKILLFRCFPSVYIKVYGSGL